ncbi:hypothetical protein KCU71_g140, partial [Aureobasidium melanogenum]
MANYTASFAVSTGTNAMITATMADLIAHEAVVGGTVTSQTAMTAMSRGNMAPFLVSAMEERHQILSGGMVESTPDVTDKSDFGDGREEIESEPESAEESSTSNAGDWTCTASARCSGMSTRVCGSRRGFRGSSSRMTTGFRDEPGGLSSWMTTGFEAEPDGKAEGVFIGVDMRVGHDPDLG